MSEAAGGADQERVNDAPRGRRLAALSLGALGVVYGDIGTSPLYALRECFHGEYGVAVTPANVLGILSLVLWSLVLVISVKYLGFVLRADNRGEGGILALVALAVPRYAPQQHRLARACSGCSAPRCSTATACSRPRSRCSPRSRASRWLRPRCARS